jgi:hypothetical protein
MSSRTKVRERAAIFGAAACVLAACSVDTSDIHFRPDREFDPENIGGVRNEAGSKGKAGSDTAAEGGEDTGGSDTGGMPAGGSPSAGAPGGGAGNIAGNNGTAGAGGMPPVTGYPCADRVQPSALIADFASITTPMQTWQDPTNRITFGLYAFPPNSPPAMTIIDSALVVEAKVSQPLGAGIWFAPCVDASAFSQLLFTVSGVRDGTEQLLLRVGVGTNDSKMIDPMNRTGNCKPPAGVNDPGYCRPPVTEVMVQAVAPPGQSISVKFADLRNGSPLATLDMSALTQLAYVEWGFIYLNGQPAYDAKVTIDDVGFK